MRTQLILAGLLTLVSAAFAYAIFGQLEIAERHVSAHYCLTAIAVASASYVTMSLTVMFWPKQRRALPKTWMLMLMLIMATSFLVAAGCGFALWHKVGKQEERYLAMSVGTFSLGTVALIFFLLDLRKPKPEPK